MKKLIILLCVACLSWGPLRGQDPISALRALNETIGNETNAIVQDELDYLVDCIDDATFRAFSYPVMEKLIDAYLCHLDFLAYTREGVLQHLPEGRRIVDDMAVAFFLFRAFDEPPQDDDPPPAADCTVRIRLMFDSQGEYPVNGKFQTEKHRHHLIADGDPEGGTYTWSLVPPDVLNTSLRTGGVSGEKATVISYLTGDFTVRVEYKVDDKICHDEIKFTFRNPALPTIGQ